MAHQQLGASATPGNSARGGLSRAAVRRHRVFWTMRLIFFIVLFVVGTVLLLGQMGQKIEHKKVGDAPSSQQSDGG